MSEAKAMVMTESGDWYLVDYDKREQFWEDELEENDIDYFAQYIGSPSAVKILEYEF